MKILGIRATGRPNGNSSIILNELLRPAREKDFEIETINLASLNLKHCTGCFGCNNAELEPVFLPSINFSNSIKPSHCPLT